MATLYDHAERLKAGKPANLDVIQGEPVTVIGASIREGSFGDSAELTVVIASGEILEVRSTGFLIVDAVRNALAAVEAEGLSEFPPMEATFDKNGQTWVIVPPEG